MHMILKRIAAPLLALYVTVGVWKGYLAVFDEGKDEPRQIYPQQVSSLPQADQEALEEGILVRNDRDLRQLLEDFLS